MKAILFILATVQVFGQSGILSPGPEFDLNPRHKPYRFDRTVTSYFAAGSNGLTLVRIGQNSLVLTSADLDGHITHSISDLASVHARFEKALIRPDGNVWLLSGGRYFYGELDLYNPAGQHVTSVRLLAPVGGSESPLAADNGQLVLRTNLPAGFAPPQLQLIHFGSVIRGQFQEQASVRMPEAIRGAISLLRGDGELLLIDKNSGDIETVSPKTGSTVSIKLDPVQSIQAAAVDLGYLYLLADQTVLKVRFDGRVDSTYRFERVRGFQPVALAVTGKSVYLVSNVGHVRQFAMD